jgi:uncharacterized protein (TIGR00369 family)
MSIEKQVWHGLPFEVPTGTRTDPSDIYRCAVRSPAHQVLGTRMLALDPDAVTLSVDWREALVGYPETGALMGGVVMSLLDHAAGLALLARLDGEAQAGGTIELRIDFLKPSSRRESIVAVGHCYHLSNLVAFVGGRAFHPDRPGDLIAKCAGTYSIGRSGNSAKNNVEFGDVVLQSGTHPASSADIREIVKRAGETRDVSMLVKSIPYFAFLGLDVLEAGGALVIRLPGWEQHLADMRTRSLHGGVVGAAMEAAAILHLLTQGVMRFAETISFTMEFLRVAGQSEICTQATVVKMGRNIAHVRCEAWQADRTRLVATAHGTFMVAESALRSRTISF